MLATTAATSYAGIFNNQTTTETDDAANVLGSGALYGNSSNTNYNGESGAGGLFRNSGEEYDLIERPNNGDGIGQNTPIGDGLVVLTACCMSMGLMKFFVQRRKRL